MTTPQNLLIRIQLSGKKGWRMPPNTIRVCRPSLFGNPFRVVQDQTGWWCMLDRRNGLLFRSERGACMQATCCFRELLDSSDLLQQAAIVELRGKNLACWCPSPDPDEPDHCHAAVLLAFVNRPGHPPAAGDAPIDRLQA